MKVLELIKDNCSDTRDVTLEEFQLKVSRYDFNSLLLALVRYLNDVPEPTFLRNSSTQYLYKQPFTAAKLLSWVLMIKPKGTRTVTDKDLWSLLNMMWAISSSKVFLDRMGINQEWFFRATKYHQFKYQGGVDLYAPARFLMICRNRKNNSLIEGFFRGLCGCSVLELASFQLLLILCGQEIYSRNNVGVFSDLVKRYDSLLPFVMAYNNGNDVKCNFKEYFSFDSYHADPIFVERPLLKINDLYCLAGPHLCWRAAENLPYDIIRRNSKNQKLFNFVYDGFEQYVGSLLGACGVEFLRGSECVDAGASAADFAIEVDNFFLAIEVKGGVVDESARGGAFGKIAFDKLENHVVKAVDQIYKTVKYRGDSCCFGMVVTLRETFFRDAEQMQSLIADDIHEKYTWDLNLLPLSNVLICSIQEFELLVNSCDGAKAIFQFLIEFVEKNKNPITAKSMLSQALPAAPRKEFLSGPHLEIMEYLKSIYPAE